MFPRPALCSCPGPPVQSPLPGHASFAHALPSGEPVSERSGGLLPLWRAAALRVGSPCREVGAVPPGKGLRPSGPPFQAPRDQGEPQAPPSPGPPCPFMNLRMSTCVWGCRCPSISPGFPSCLGPSCLSTGPCSLHRSGRVSALPPAAQERARALGSGFSPQPLPLWSWVCWVPVIMGVVDKHPQARKKGQCGHTSMFFCPHKFSVSILSHSFKKNLHDYLRLLLDSQK